MYELAKVYKALGITPPDPKILADLQLIHDTLNDPRKTDRYFEFVNEMVEHRVRVLGWTPTESLVLTFKESVEAVRHKLPKLFEPTPDETEFIKTIGPRKRPFHDVSAGLFHGEYEHALQLDFIRRMYEYPHWFGTTELKTTYTKAWEAMFDEKYVVTIDKGGKEGEPIKLSLWDLVLDIQGGFLRGGEVDAKGLAAIEGFEQSYKPSYATSATFMHHAFGAYGIAKPETYKQVTGVLGGDLAKKFPYLAAAIIDRHMKREKEAIKGGWKGTLGLKGYQVVVHSEEDKQKRRNAVIELIAELTENKVQIQPWKVKPSRKNPNDTGNPRKNNF